MSKILGTLVAIVVSVGLVLGSFICTRRADYLGTLVLLSFLIIHAGTWATVIKDVKYV